MIKILMGGSPCTHWSIAQNKNRETEASGQGWELFKNYLTAKEKFKPDFFLYENNKSAAAAIKNQISKDLGVDLMYINSALVSAQNRERFYCFNGGGIIPPPEDRGILLQDILESGIVDHEKAHCLKHQAGNARDYFKKHYTQIAFEPILFPINTTTDGKSRTIRASYYKDGARNFIGNNIDRKTAIAIPVNTITENEKRSGFDAVYEVKNGFITYKDKQYPIKLLDGYYYIRKLTPIECERLQTLPDNYTAGISDTQRYKCLGNGWTAEVIIHILKNTLKNVPRSEKLFVLSMYDGIATGRYCLEQLGFTDIEYHAYEIDKYAKQIELKNYPDIIQHGDAFEVRNSEWRIYE